MGPLKIEIGYPPKQGRKAGVIWVSLHTHQKWVRTLQNKGLNKLLAASYNHGRIWIRITLKPCSRLLRHLLAVVHPNLKSFSSAQCGAATALQPGGGFRGSASARGTPGAMRLPKPPVFETGSTSLLEFMDFKLFYRGWFPKMMSEDLVNIHAHFLVAKLLGGKDSRG